MVNICFQTRLPLQGEGLAESVMAVGYLWYCKAGRLVNQKGFSARKKLQGAHQPAA